MKIRVDGVEYTRFVATTATLRMDAVADTFSFEAASKEGVPLPFKGGEACVILVDGEQVIEGYIEIVSVSGAKDDHTILIDGRDKTGDLLDSSVGALSDIRAPISLKRICEIVIRHLLGEDATAEDLAKSIKVIDDVEPALFETAEDLAAPEPGLNAFEFLEEYARKRQVFLSSNSDGNLLITQGAGVKTDGILQNRISDLTNNVMSYSVTYDTTGRFNVYRMASQANPASGFLASLNLSPANLVDQSSEILDKVVRRGRQLTLIAEHPSGKDAGKSRAEWERDIRRARGTVYSATVDGYRDHTGALWTPNTIVRVFDEYAGLDTPMLISSVQYAIEPGTGRTTTISLVEEDAYTLKLEEPEEKTKETGFDWSAV